MKEPLIETLNRHSFVGQLREPRNCGHRAAMLRVAGVLS